MNATKVISARLVYAVALLLAGHAMAQDGGKAISKTTISLGTATPGGGFPLYGNAFAEIINAADPNAATGLGARQFLSELHEWSACHDQSATLARLADAT